MLCQWPPSTGVVHPPLEPSCPAPSPAAPLLPAPQHPCSQPRAELVTLSSPCTGAQQGWQKPCLSCCVSDSGGLGWSRNTATHKGCLGSSSEAHPQGAPSPKLPSPVHGDAVTEARVRATMGSGSPGTWQGAGNTTNPCRQDKHHSQQLGCTRREQGGGRKSSCLEWMAQGSTAHGAFRYSLKRFALSSPASLSLALFELETGPVRYPHGSGPL